MRVKRGALNLIPAAKLVDKKVSLWISFVSVADGMIESFMLIANETVAEHYMLDLPSIEFTRSLRLKSSEVY